MIRKCIALFLSMLLVFQTIPVVATSETALYIYPEVEAYVQPSDLAALEMEFRKWAAELMYDYYADDYAACEYGNGTKAPFSEYYRLADTKGHFDLDQRNNDNVVYNVTYGGKNQDDSLYTWVLLESLKEAVLINSDQVMEDYYSMPPSERKFMMLDISSGSLKKDEYVVVAQRQSDAIMYTEWLNAAADTAILAADTFAQYKVVASGNNVDMLSSLTAMIADATDACVDTIIEGAKNNMLLAAKNDVRSLLANDMASALLNLNTQAVLFLKNAYGNAFPGFEKTKYSDLIVEFLRITDPEQNKELIQIMGTTASETVDTNEEISLLVDQTMNSYGYELLETIDVGSIVVLGLLDGVREALIQFVDYLVAQLDKKIENISLDIPLPGGKKITVGLSTFVNALAEVAKNTIDRGITGSIDEYYESYMNGNPVDSSIVELVLNNISDEFLNHALDDFFNNTIGGLTEDATDSLIRTKDTALQPIVNEMAKTITTLSLEEKSIQEKVYKLFEALMKQLASYGAKQISSKNSLSSLFNNRVYYKRDKAAKELQYAENRQELSKFLKKETYKDGQRVKNAQKKLDALQERIDITERISLVTVLGNVWDRAWETGVSIRAALDSTVAKCNGEGRVSLWAARVYTAKKMSKPLLYESATGIVELIGSTNCLNKEMYVQLVCDPDRTSLKDIVAIVSMIETELKYDIVGSKSYYDIAFHVFVGKEYIGFVYKEKDNVMSSIGSSKFMQYVNKNHQNVRLYRGLVNDFVAEQFYDRIVQFKQKYFDDRWNSEWNVFFVN